MGYAEELAARVRAKQAGSKQQSFSQERRKQSKSQGRSALPNRSRDVQHSSHQASSNFVDLLDSKGDTPASAERDISQNHHTILSHQKVVSPSLNASEEIIDLTSPVTDSAENPSTTVSPVRKRPRAEIEPTKAVEPDNAEPKAKRSFRGTGRGAKYRPVPSKAVLDRMERALLHRLYLVGKLREDAALLEREYAIMGSGGNIYKVTIGRDPRCECPDYQKRNGDPCKHIFFVLGKVLGVARDDPCLWQKRLIKEEVEKIFEDASRRELDSAVLVDRPVVEAFSKIHAAEKNGGNGASERSRTCAICIEDFDAEKKATVWCKSCKNELHGDCMNKWLRVRSAGDATCPYCREPWVQGGNETVNLASVSARYRKAVPLEEMYPDTHAYIGGSRRSRAAFFARQRRR